MAPINFGGVVQKGLNAIGLLPPETSPTTQAAQPSSGTNITINMSQQGAAAAPQGQAAPGAPGTVTVAAAEQALSTSPPVVTVVASSVQPRVKAVKTLDADESSATVTAQEESAEVSSAEVSNEDSVSTDVTGQDETSQEDNSNQSADSDNSEHDQDPTEEKPKESARTDKRKKLKNKSLKQQESSESSEKDADSLTNGKSSNSEDQDSSGSSNDDQEHTEDNPVASGDQSPADSSKDDGDADHQSTAKEKSPDADEEGSNASSNDDDRGDHGSTAKKKPSDKEKEGSTESSKDDSTSTSETSSDDANQSKSHRRRDYSHRKLRVSGFTFLKPRMASPLLLAMGSLTGSATQPTASLPWSTSTAPMVSARQDSMSYASQISGSWESSAAVTPSPKLADALAAFGAPVTYTTCVPGQACHGSDGTLTTSYPFAALANVARSYALSLASAPGSMATGVASAGYGYGLASGSGGDALYSNTTNGLASYGVPMPPTATTYGMPVRAQPGSDAPYPGMAHGTALNAGASGVFLGTATSIAQGAYQTAGSGVHTAGDAGSPPAASESVPFSKGFPTQGSNMHVRQAAADEYHESSSYMPIELPATTVQGQPPSVTEIRTLQTIAVKPSLLRKEVSDPISNPATAGGHTMLDPNATATETGADMARQTRSAKLPPSNASPTVPATIAPRAAGPQGTVTSNNLKRATANTPPRPKGKSTLSGSRSSKATPGGQDATNSNPQKPGSPAMGNSISDYPDVILYPYDDKMWAQLTIGVPRKELSKGKGQITVGMKPGDKNKSPTSGASNPPGSAGQGSQGVGTESAGSQQRDKNPSLSGQNPANQPGGIGKTPKQGISGTAEGADQRSQSVGAVSGGNQQSSVHGQLGLGAKSSPSNSLVRRRPALERKDTGFVSKRSANPQSPGGGGRGDESGEGADDERSRMTRLRDEARGKWERFRIRTSHADPPAQMYRPALQGTPGAERAPSYDRTRPPPDSGSGSAAPATGSGHNPASGSGPGSAAPVPGNGQNQPQQIGRPSGDVSNRDSIATLPLYRGERDSNLQVDAEQRPPSYPGPTDASNNGQSLPGPDPGRDAPPGSGSTPQSGSGIAPGSSSQVTGGQSSRGPRPPAGSGHPSQPGNSRLLFKRAGHTQSSSGMEKQNRFHHTTPRLKPRRVNEKMRCEMQRLLRIAEQRRLDQIAEQRRLHQIAQQRTQSALMQSPSPVYRDAKHDTRLETGSSEFSFDYIDPPPAYSENDPYDDSTRASSSRTGSAGSGRHVKRTETQGPPYLLQRRTLPQELEEPPGSLDATDDGYEDECEGLTSPEAVESSRLLVRRGNEQSKSKDRKDKKKDKKEKKKDKKEKKKDKKKKDKKGKQLYEQPEQVDDQEIYPSIELGANEVQAGPSTQLAGPAESGGRSGAPSPGSQSPVSESEPEPPQNSSQDRKRPPTPPWPPKNKRPEDYGLERWSDAPPYDRNRIMKEEHRKEMYPDDSIETEYPPKRPPSIASTVSGTNRWTGDRLSSDRPRYSVPDQMSQSIPSDPSLHRSPPKGSRGSESGQSQSSKESSKPPSSKAQPSKASRLFRRADPPRGPPPPYSQPPPGGSNTPGSPSNNPSGNPAAGPSGTQGQPPAGGSSPINPPPYQGQYHPRQTGQKDIPDQGHTQPKPGQWLANTDTYPDTPDYNTPDALSEDLRNQDAQQAFWQSHGAQYQNADRTRVRSGRSRSRSGSQDQQPFEGAYRSGSPGPVPPSLMHRTRPAHETTLDSDNRQTSRHSSLPGAQMRDSAVGMPEQMPGHVGGSPQRQRRPATPGGGLDGAAEERPATPGTEGGGSPFGGAAGHRIDREVGSGFRGTTRGRGSRVFGPREGSQGGGGGRRESGLAEGGGEGHE